MNCVTQWSEMKQQNINNPNTEKTTLFGLLISFFKIGIMTFGGGYAMLPMLERECVQKHGWITSDELLDYFAIGQMTPGVIAVNTATFVGYKKRGTIGSVFATIGILLPSLFIITALASVLKAYQNNIYLNKAFNGIRVSVCALILGSLIKMAKKSIKNVQGIILGIFSLAAEIILGISPVIITISTILLSLAVFYFSRKKEEK